jgi:hypothetical protein
MNNGIITTQGGLKSGSCSPQEITWDFQTYKYYVVEKVWKKMTCSADDRPEAGALHRWSLQIYEELTKSTTSCCNTFIGQCHGLNTFILIWKQFHTRELDTFCNIVTWWSVTTDEVSIGNWISWNLYIQLVATNNNSSNANSHTLQFTTEHTNASQFAVSSPVVAW